jgi:hypothetical protein
MWMASIMLFRLAVVVPSVCTISVLFMTLVVGDGGDGDGSSSSISDADNIDTIVMVKGRLVEPRAKSHVFAYSHILIDEEDNIAAELYFATTACLVQ